MSSAECLVGVYSCIPLVDVNRPNVHVENFVVCIVGKMAHDVGMV